MSQRGWRDLLAADPVTVRLTRGSGNKVHIAAWPDGAAPATPDEPA